MLRHLMLGLEANLNLSGIETSKRCRSENSANVRTTCPNKIHRLQRYTFVQIKKDRGKHTYFAGARRHDANIPRRLLELRPVVLLQELGKAKSVKCQATEVSLNWHYLIGIIYL